MRINGFNNYIFLLETLLLTGTNLIVFGMFGWSWQYFLIGFCSFAIIFYRLNEISQFIAQEKEE